MQQEKYVTIISHKKKILLNTDTILYVLMEGNNAAIHVSGGRVYQTRMTLSEISEYLGDSFIKVHRGCIVSAMAIHDITDNINLNNGESLSYTVRKKKEIIARFHKKQKGIINSFTTDGIPKTQEEYRRYYASFESLPFAFTDIEMVFNEERHAVDWIFRYGNPALSKLEKLPLTKLIGRSFGSLYANMDSKWLKGYERATLLGETIEMMDYSPEIDTYLKVICFPTFPGHCGCILFDMRNIKLVKNSSFAESALQLYLGNPG